MVPLDLYQQTPFTTELQETGGAAPYQPRNRYQWQPWFAWYPVLVRDPEFVGPFRHKWLCWIDRRMVGGIAPNGDLADGQWQYRLPGLGQL